MPALPAMGADSVQPKTQSPHSWLVFFLNGQIVYAGTTDGNLDRLRGYLHRYNLDNSLKDLDVPAIATFNSPEYGYLWALLENHA
jgi:twitching motility two-component system response regulator PilG